MHSIIFNNIRAHVHFRSEGRSTNGVLESEHIKIKDIKLHSQK